MCRFSGRLEGSLEIAKINYKKSIKERETQLVLEQFDRQLEKAIKNREKSFALSIGENEEIANELVQELETAGYDVIKERGFIYVRGWADET